MLSNVLDDYFSRIKDERAFDAPFMALLPAMGFYDIHFTHGQVEFGKDFIAKRVDRHSVVQYSFQSKCGDINQSNWRNSIQGQMLEAVISGLRHPNFDSALPHQSVLVTTGRLIGNAAAGLQGLNEQIKRLRLKEVKLWERPNLVASFSEFASEAILHATASTFISLGRFYIEYGKSFEGKLSDRDIETFSREWIGQTDGDSRSAVIVTIEAAILAAKCKENGALYEACYCLLGGLRAIFHTLHVETDVVRRQWLKELYGQLLASLYSACREYISACRQKIAETEWGLLRHIEGGGNIATYPVHCSRIIEIAGLLYFLSKIGSERNDLVEFLTQFVSEEQGCCHIIADRFAVALVPAILAMVNADHDEDATKFLRQVAIWICDRYEEGYGLARLESSVYDEVSVLLGYPFEAIGVEKSTSSFAATVVSDLSAFVGNGPFYSDVVNDFKACNIAFSYWQVKDSTGQYLFEANDVVQYPNIEYQDELSSFEAYEFAEHIANEPITFELAEEVDPVGYLGLSLLLRDRYFPTIWPKLTPQVRTA